MRGVVRGVNVDTRFFTGNYPSHCSIDAADVAGTLHARAYAATDQTWTTVLSQTTLRGDGDNFFVIDDGRPWTHLRLNIYPDGGVARLRVYGEVIIDWARTAKHGQPVDLAAIVNGGLVIDASDRHYGNPNNMLMPGRAPNMGDGWETRRRRGPGHDWAVVRLGARAMVSRVEIDTNHYKGNYPDSASLEGLQENGEWTELLPQTKLRAHHRHFFAKELRKAGVVSQVRLNIFPDGGISRLRVHGIVALD
jgi:allantoicase